MKLRQLAPEARSHTGWIKSTYSHPNGACLLVKSDGDRVLIKDSKYAQLTDLDPMEEPIISLPAQEWESFRFDIASGRPISTSYLRTTEAADGSVNLVSTYDKTSLVFTSKEWQAFVAGASEGQLDLQALAAA